MDLKYFVFFGIIQQLYLIILHLFLTLNRIHSFPDNKYTKLPKIHSQHSEYTIKSKFSDKQYKNR